MKRGQIWVGVLLGLLTILVSSVRSNPIFVQETDQPRLGDPAAALVPDWKQNVAGEFVRYSDEATAKPGEISDVLGSGLNGLLDGIAKAPASIANRVQGFFQGLLRRPSTQTPGSTGGGVPAVGGGAATAIKDVPLNLDS